MYPAEGLYNGDYTVDDLPDVVTASAGSYEKVDPPEMSAAGYLAYYKNGTNPIGSGDENVIVLIDEAIPKSWQVWNGGSISGGGACLITGDGNLTPGDDAVEDQFAATYVVKWNDDGEQSVPVTRVSLCLWQGEDLGDEFFAGGPVALEYNSEIQKFIVTTPRGRSGDNYSLSSDKLGFQNSPLGDYEEGEEVQE